MIMSFGFSVGDFIGAVNPIAEVVSALSVGDGSTSQCQHIMNKLGYLDCAIRDVNQLESIKGFEVTLDAVTTIVLSCQLPLLEYLENIRSYDESLGPGESSSVMEYVLIKVKWKVSKKLEAIMKLKAEIVSYLRSY